MELARDERRRPARSATPVDRIEGREKVTGAARTRSSTSRTNVAYAVIVAVRRSPTARVRAVDAGDALALAGVLAVLHARQRARARPAARELAVLQSPEVAYRGQIVAAVVADEPRDGPAGGRARPRRTTTRASTTSCSAPTIPASTRRTRSTRTSRPTPRRATSRPRSPAPRSRSTRRTRRRRSTTIRWSRTPRSRSGTTSGSRSTTRPRARGTSRRPSPKLFGLEPDRCASSPSTSAAASGRRARRARMSCSPRSARGSPAAPVKLAVTRQQMFTLDRLSHADDPAAPARGRAGRPAGRASRTTSSSRRRRCRSSPSRRRSPPG